MSDLITTLHPINDDTTDLYPNVKNENIPPVVSGKDAMEALEGSFDTLRTDEMQIGGDNGTIINSTQIATPNKVINLDDIVDDAELAQGLNGKVDKVQGKGLSTNDFTDAYKTELDNLPTDLNGKVDKVSGKGLSTNDFTDAYKQDLDTDIPEQFQLIKDNVEGLGHALINKVDKVSGKGLSTNDYTNADKALVDTIPDKVDKVQGKGLSTNDFTNADKAYLDNLPNYFISIASGGVVDVENPASSTPYFGAKHGTTSNFLLRDSQVSAKVTGSSGVNWSFIMTGNANFAPSFNLIIPPSGDTPSRVTQYKLPLGITKGSHELALRDDLDSLLTVVQYTAGENANASGRICRFKDVLFFDLNIDFYGVEDSSEVLLTIDLPFEEGEFGILIVDNEGGEAFKLLNASWVNSQLELTLDDLQVGESHDVVIQGSALVNVY